MKQAELGGLCQAHFSANQMVVGVLELLEVLGLNSSQLWLRFELKCSKLAQSTSPGGGSGDGEWLD